MTMRVLDNRIDVLVVEYLSGKPRVEVRVARFDPKPPDISSRSRGVAEGVSRCWLVSGATHVDQYLIA